MPKATRGINRLRYLVKSGEHLHLMGAVEIAQAAPTILRELDELLALRIAASTFMREQTDENSRVLREMLGRNED